MILIPTWHRVWFWKEGEREPMSKKKRKDGAAKSKPISLKLKVLLIILIVLCVIIGAILGGNFIYNQNFGVTFYQITSDKVSDNIRIVELADLHNSEFGKNNSKLIEKIDDLNPDLIFYAGDMINKGKDNDYSVLFDLSDKLSEIAPIYACYGNNELDQQLFIDNTFKKQLISHRVNLLSNEDKNVTVGNTTIQLIAVSDNVDQFDVETNNSKKFVERLKTTSNCRICLTHYPELFKEKLLNRDIDIAFCGHTHGGLVRLPFIGGLYTTGEGFMPDLTDGVVTMEDDTKVVISRGLGNNHLVPRLFNQPELVVVDICWY